MQYQHQSSSIHKAKKKKVCNGALTTASPETGYNSNTRVMF